jgi:hypothetical protein
VVKREGERGECWALNNTWCGVDRKPRSERGQTHAIRKRLAWQAQGFPPPKGAEFFPSKVSPSAWTQ